MGEDMTFMDPHDDANRAAVSYMQTIRARSHDRDGDLLSRSALMEELEQRLLLISTPKRVKDAGGIQEYSAGAINQQTRQAPVGLSAMVTRCRSLEEAVDQLRTTKVDNSAVDATRKSVTPPEHRALVAELQSRLARAEDTEQVLLDELRAVSRSNAVLRKANEDISKSKSHVENQMVTLRTRLNNLRRCTPPKQPQPAITPCVSVDASEPVITALKAQVEAFSRALAHQHQVSEIECCKCKQLPQMEQRIQELEQEEFNLRERLDIYEGECSHLKSDLCSERKEGERVRSELVELSARNEALSQELVQTYEKLDSLKSRVEETNHKTLSVTCELRRVRKELGSLKSADSLVHQPKAKSESALIDARRDQFVARRMAELENTNSVYWRKIQRLNTTVSELHAQIKEIERKELAKAPVHVRKRPPPIQTEDLDSTQSPVIALEPGVTRTIAQLPYRRHFRGLIQTTDPDPICVRVDHF